MPNKKFVHKDCVHKDCVVILKSSLKSLGGLEKYTHLIISRLLEKNKKVLLITSDTDLTSLVKTGLDKTCSKNDSFFHKTIKCNKLFSFFKVFSFDRKVKKFLSKKEYKTILGMERNSHQTHIRAGNGSHRTFLTRRFFYEPFYKRLFFHISPLHYIFLKIEKKAFENPNLKKLITNSYMVKEEIQNFYNIDPKKIKVIHNGIRLDDSKEAFSTYEKKYFKEKDQRDVFTFLFIGSGYKRKGLYNLLKAFSKIFEKDFRLIVIGKDKNINFYKKLCIKLKIDKKVEFLNEQKNVYKYYQMSDCFVLPTFYDPFANVTLEALSMGLYVITSKYNGAKEVLLKNHSSVIDNLFSTDSIVDELNKAFSFKKNKKSAQIIRDSIKHLDYDNQLDKFANEIIS
jgi:UDP-glucose:(heptosyl)LPS alpha-1,3-glucosyltransferase